MSRRTVTFTSQTTRNFVPNHQRGPEYNASIQNNTGQSITITVTNQNIQGVTPAFTAPVTALVIATGAMAFTNEPYDGWLITAAASTSGTVDIVEAG